VGGVFGPILAGKVADASGNYNAAYIISAALLIFAGLLTFFTKAPAPATVAVPARVAPAPVMKEAAAD
jgi:predicted MFS family arabinose efflux permease